MHERIERAGASPRAWRAGLRNGTIAAAALVALIIAFAPVSQAATASHGPAMTRMTGPWTGATSSHGTSVTTSGCAGAKITATPAFHWMNGLTTMGLAAHSSNCNSLGGSYGYSDGSVEVTIPLTLPAGTSVVTAHWDVRATLSADLTAVTCAMPNSGSTSNTSYSDCEANSEASLSGYVYLWDTTSGATYFPATFWSGIGASTSFYDYCYAGSCYASFSGSNHVSVLYGVSMHIRVHGANTNDTFELVMYIYGSAYSQDYSYDATMTGGAAHATVDLMGPQDGVKLAWVGFL